MQRQRNYVMLRVDESGRECESLHNWRHGFLPSDVKASRARKGDVMKYATSFADRTTAQINQRLSSNDTVVQLVKTMRMSMDTFVMQLQYPLVKVGRLISAASGVSRQ